MVCLPQPNFSFTEILATTPITTTTTTTGDETKLLM
jgi:hypothetical protein